MYGSAGIPLYFVLRSGTREGRSFVGIHTPVDHIHSSQQRSTIRPEIDDQQAFLAKGEEDTILFAILPYSEGPGCKGTSTALSTLVEGRARVRTLFHARWGGKGKNEGRPTHYWVLILDLVGRPRSSPVACDSCSLDVLSSFDPQVSEARRCGHRHDNAFSFCLDRTK